MSCGEIDDTSNKKNRVNINLNLMCEDILVAKLILNYLPLGRPRIKIIEIVKEELLPYELRTKQLSFISWFINRCLACNTHRVFFLTQFVTRTGIRSQYATFFLSLLTHSVNLTDKYWFNVDKLATFKYDEMTLMIQPTTWEKLEPFKNKFVSEVVNNCSFNDNFFYLNEDDDGIGSLNWATNGDTHKRWIIENDKYVLEKRLYEDRYKKEIETFAFFKERGIKTPKYEGKYIVVEDDHRRYSLDVIKTGYYSIKKECLTDERTRLEPLICYVDKDDNEFATPIRRMCDMYNVPSEEIESFIKAINEYIECFNIALPGYIDTRNFGLLVNEDGAAEPVVWSGLQVVINTFYDSVRKCQKE